MTKKQALLNNFKDLSEDLESLLNKTTDLLLDSYTGTATEISALKYLEQIKTLSQEIDSKMTESKLNQQPIKSLHLINEVEKLIKKRNELLKHLGIIV